jgi:NhaA family Na+:H+ antiporter
MARRVPSALRAFLSTEAASGAVLMAATVVALLWANSPWHAGYHDTWDGLRSFIDDGLMSVFFYVVGVEIKRELVVGELREPRTAALPIVGAIGGMVVPALLFALFNHGHPGGHGWGVPMATDIAFAVGVLTLLGRRVPSSLKVFLLTLAIADDIGAIVVIALFYASGVHLLALLLGLAALAAIAGLRRLGQRALVPCLVLAAVAWVAVDRSGVHPTIAAVALGLLTPAAFAPAVESRLHPWTGFVIVPLFALANAGVHLGGVSLDDRVVLGVVVGLVAGKTIGISLASWLAVRTGLGSLPVGVRWRHLVGVATLGGIGFTVALFVGELAFEAGTLEDSAKAGVLLASVLAAVLGTAALALPARR